LAPDPILETRELVAGYVPDVDILHGVNVVVRPGEIVTLVGPNGAGKSTLVKAIIGLLPPRSGRVLLHGDDITGERPYRIVRRGVGYVPQRENVFPSMTVDENIDLGLAARRDDDPGRRHDVFDLFPRLAERRRQPAGTLSGGERQMLAMARTLASRPELVLLDESSAGLSPIAVEAVFAKIAEINAAGTTILMVEQSARRALSMSHRGYVLDVGRNRFTGSGTELLHDPKVIDLYLRGSRRIDHEPRGSELPRHGGQETAGRGADANHASPR
jgi:ABC-type branched-subunit amino acid transport system ATPase component